MNDLHRMPEALTGCRSAAITASAGAEGQPCRKAAPAENQPVQS